MCLFHTLLLRVLHHYSYVFSVEYYRLMVSTIVNLVIKPGVAVMCRHSLQGQSASSTPWCTGCFSACCGSIQRCCGAGFSAVHASRGEQAGVFSHVPRGRSHLPVGKSCFGRLHAGRFAPASHCLKQWRIYSSFCCSGAGVERPADEGGRMFKSLAPVGLVCYPSRGQ